MDSYLDPSFLYHVDPDQTFYFDAHQDPNFHLDADPDTTFHLDGETGFVLMDPDADPGDPKTYASCGSGCGSGSGTLDSWMHGFVKQFSQMVGFAACVEKAKKLTQCFSCGDLNGVVKKCGLLKISHEKYRWVRLPGKSDPFRGFESTFFLCGLGPNILYFT
jgi:hypothetical protein